MKYVYIRIVVGRGIVDEDKTFEIEAESLGEAIEKLFVDKNDGPDSLDYFLNWWRGGDPHINWSRDLVAGQDVVCLEGEEIFYLIGTPEAVDRVKYRWVGTFEDWQTGDEQWLDSFTVGRI